MTYLKIKDTQKEPSVPQAITLTFLSVRVMTIQKKKNPHALKLLFLVYAGVSHASAVLLYWLCLCANVPQMGLSFSLFDVTECLLLKAHLCLRIGMGRLSESENQVMNASSFRCRRTEMNCTEHAQS